MVARLEGPRVAALQHVESPERGVILLDEELRITGANPRAMEILGLAQESLDDATLPPSLGRRPSDAEEVIDEVLEMAAPGATVIHRYSSPVHSPDGGLLGRVEIYSDITARRELEREIVERNSQLASLNRQLREAQEQLIHSERLRTLGEMAAGVAHDINNVLGIVLGNAQLAKRKLEPGTDIMRCVEGIELAARDAAETVRRLREIGKPVGTSHYYEVDLSDLARDLVDTALPAWTHAESGGQQVRVETDLQSGCVVSGDATEIREALGNILLNAIQASAPGDKIELSTSPTKDGVDVTVQDHGTGMDQETQSRLFDPFFTTRGAQGTGLGMSMVDAVMIRHGGRIRVESEKCKGTRVTLSFPPCRRQGAEPSESNKLRER